MPVRPASFHDKALALALLAFAANGCLHTPRNHYVKSAETSTASIPLAPAVVPGENRKIDLTLRAGFRGPTRTDLATRPVYGATPEPGSQGFRGDYALRQTPRFLGIELREKPYEAIDWYLTAGVNPGKEHRAAGLLGLGFTLPFPLLNVRMSPAIGLHAYTYRVVDSVISYEKPLFGSTRIDTSTHVLSGPARRLGLVGSFSVSA